MSVNRPTMGRGAPGAALVTSDAGACASGRCTVKFGRNSVVGTTEEDVWEAGGTYVWEAAAFTLEVVSAGANAANDTAAGSGAREVSVECVTAAGAVVTVKLPTNGTSAGVEVAPTSVAAVNRAWVSDSGTVSTGPTTGGIAGADGLTVQITGAGNVQCKLLKTINQTRILRYTVPTTLENGTAVLGAEVTAIDISSGSDKDLTARLVRRSAGAAVTFDCFREAWGQVATSGHHAEFNDGVPIILAVGDSISIRVSLGASTDIVGGTMNIRMLT